MLGGLSWIGLIIGFVFCTAVLCGIILLVILAVRRSVSGNAPASNPPPQSPKEIVQLRYARGEITREQYQQMVDDLNH